MFTVCKVVLNGVTDIYWGWISVSLGSLKNVNNENVMFFHSLNSMQYGPTVCQAMCWKCNGSQADEVSAVMELNLSWGRPFIIWWLFLHAPIQQIFLEHPLCTLPFSGYWVYSSKTINEWYCSPRTCIYFSGRRETINNNANIQLW